MSNRKLFLSGDIHGEWKELVWTLTVKYGITEADVVVLGDFGIGFDNSMPGLYKRTEKRLEEADIVIHALRGNHDDPEFFNGEHDYPRLKFLKDSTVYTFCGDKKALILGGACSTDITWRLKENQELASKGKSTRVWWPGEDIKKTPIKDLPSRVDLILSHEAPLSFDPVLIRMTETPEYQYEKIKDSRKYLEEVFNEVWCDRWYYGHYHNHYLGTTGRTSWRGLGIMEIVEVRFDNEVS